MKKFSFLLLSVVFIFHTSCNKCDILALADLIISTAKLAFPEVAIAEPLIMNIVLKNVKDDCDTYSAPNSEVGISAEYKPDINSPWVDAEFQNDGVSYFNVTVPNNSLEQGETDLLETGFSFDTPGIYRFTLLADKMDVVEERNENNNGSQSDRGDVGRMGYSAYESDEPFKLTVTVYDPLNIKEPNYDYQTIPTVLEHLGGE